MMSEDVPPPWPFVRGGVDPSPRSGLDPVDALELCLGQKSAQEIVISTQNTELRNKASEIVRLTDDKLLLAYRNVTLEQFQAQSDEKCKACVEWMAVRTSQHDAAMRHARARHDALESEVEQLRRKASRQKQRREDVRRMRSDLGAAQIENNHLRRLIHRLEEGGEKNRKRSLDREGASPPPSPPPFRARDTISVRKMIVPAPAVSLGRM